MIELKDHQVAQFVNELTKVAKTYGQTQQLRDRISDVVQRTLQVGAHAPKTMQMAPSCIGKPCACPKGQCSEAQAEPSEAVTVNIPVRPPPRPFPHETAGVRQLRSSLSLQLSEDLKAARTRQWEEVMRHSDDDTHCYRPSSLG